MRECKRITGAMKTALQEWREINNFKGVRVAINMSNGGMFRVRAWNRSLSGSYLYVQSMPSALAPEDQMSIWVEAHNYMRIT